MSIPVICFLLLLIGHAHASTYGFNCAIDGTLSVAGKQVLPLTAGTGIALTNNGTYIVVDATASASSATTNLTSTGGTSLVSSGVGPGLSILGLTAGSGIKLFASATDVTINSTVNLTSTGGTTSLVSSGVSPNLSILGLTAGSGIKLFSSATDVTISSNVNLTSAGGTSLVSNGTGPALAVLGLSQGSGIVLTPSATAVTVSASATPFYVKANVALTASVTTVLFALTPSVSTNYGIDLILYPNLPLSGTLTASILAEGTGSSQAGTIGCGFFSRLGSGGSSITAGTLATTNFNINAAQSLAATPTNNGAGVLMINCYLTTSANAFTTLKLQVQSTTAATVYTGSTATITASPQTN